MQQMELHRSKQTCVVPALQTHHGQLSLTLPLTPPTQRRQRPYCCQRHHSVVGVWWWWWWCISSNSVRIAVLGFTSVHGDPSLSYTRRRQTDRQTGLQHAPLKWLTSNIQFTIFFCSIFVLYCNIFFPSFSVRLKFAVDITFSV